MIVKVFSVFDSVAQVFSPPFFQVNEATAIRGFRQGIQQGTNQQAEPQDLSLYVLGDYNDNTGELIR